MSNKIKYIEFSNNCDEVNIFSQPWWLDVVVGEENWDVVISEKGGVIQGALPYYYVKKGKYLCINQPLLTPRHGIILNYPKNQKKTTKISFERKVIKELMEKLENLNLDSYNQNFSYNFKNWLPLYWKEFKQTTRYSYIINKNCDIEEVYNNIDSSTKNLIRKAEKSVIVKRDISIYDFYKINLMTYSRKNIQIPYSFKLVEDLDKECEKRNCRKILAGIDEQGNIHAAIYIVWDKQYMYYLMGGVNTEFKASNATSLLLYNAIQLSKEKRLNFDFEGSMDEGIEKFFSSFGGEQTAYSNISKRYRMNLKSELSRFISNTQYLKSLLGKIKRR
ncbi:GNAT family N-acetyltransferase [Clostridium sp.]|uniref:GNAT family N-acetyltransferase n=1 Tax=Clostridium sp. TaxID=1506 RepID=UPI00321673D9